MTAREVAGSSAEVPVALLALALLGAFSLLSPAAFGVAHWSLAAASCALAAWALQRAHRAAGIALVGAGICVAACSHAPWPLVLPVALGAVALGGRYRPEAGTPRQPRGTIPAAGTIACGAVTPVALLGWLALARPNLSDLSDQVPHAAPWLLVLGGLAFAVGNATLEEWVWRGVIQTRLDTLMSSGLAILVQATSFGLAHAHGFPRGASGMCLAGTWALMLGLLRKRSSGLLAPILAHVVADATIAVVLLRSAVISRS